MGWGRGGCYGNPVLGPAGAAGDRNALEARLAALEAEAESIRKLLSEEKRK
ncbi:MAG: hypothetical protein WC588_04545 [Candidatus Micrarchaeia archaeon]